MTQEADRQRIARIVEARRPCAIVVTAEEHYALELIESVVGETLVPLWEWSVVQGIRAGGLVKSEPLQDTDHPAAALYHLATDADARQVCVMLDVADHLDDARTLRALRETIHRFRRTGSSLFLVGHRDDYPDVVGEEAIRVELSLPDADELETIVKDALRGVHRRNPIEVSLSRRQMGAILRNLRGLTRHQAEQIVIETVSGDLRFDIDDLNHIVAAKRQHLDRAGVLEYVETPVDLAEIGGLRSLKRWLRHRRDADSERAAAFGLGAPRGILLLGVQGAGKSLSAKAIATAWQRPLLRLDPGALYDRFVGESERRLRLALRQAEMMAPIVLWIDEIEKGFASAAAHSTDGGLSQRMFGTLLTWMQEHEAPVFLVATANNIDALPPELLRKGRFDEIFFVDLPGASTRRQIIAIHLRRRGRDPAGFDVGAIAQACDGYSGAEIEQAIVAALHEAFADDAELTTGRVVDALQASPPLSVTMAERVASLRAWARNRCVPAE